MAQVEKSILRGLILPHERMEWWDAESGEYDAGGTRLASLPSGGPLPGIPTPTSTTSTGMVLQASGTQSARGALDVLCQRGGFPDRDRASFLWKNNADTEYYGWDAPNVLVAHQPISWTSSAAAASLFPHAVTLADGTVVVAVQLVGAGAQTTIQAWVRSPSAGTWASHTIYLNPLQTQSAHPCLVLLPSGRLLCFFWYNDEAADYANVRMLYSDDSGTTWSLGQLAVLADSVPTATATGAGSLNYSTGRLRAAYSNGQVLLLANVLSMDVTGASHLKRDALWQFASLDLGATFTLVVKTESSGTVTQGANFHDIVVLDGRFVVAYLDVQLNTPSVRILTNAFDPWSNSPVIDGAPGGEPWGTLDGGTSKYYDVGDLCLFRDESGVLYLTGREVTVDNCWVVYSSSDGGATWVVMAASSGSSGAGKWWDTDDTATHPQGACATWQRGRALVIHGHASNPGIYDESLSCSYLGGYSTVTMPSYQAFRAQKRQVTWGQTYNAYDLPSDCSWTRTVTGAPTESVSTGVLALAAGVLEAIHYERAPSGSIATGLLATITVAVSAGTYRYDCRIGSVTAGYWVEVRITPTTVEVWDQVAGTQIGVTATYAGSEVQIELGMEDNNLVVYHRVYSAADDARAFVLTASSSALTDDAAATFTAFRVRHGMDAPGGIGPARAAAVRQVAYVTDEGTATNYVGDNITGQDNPRDLLGRPFSSVATYVSDGVCVKAVSGPAFHGDAWDIDVRYQRPPENLLPTVTPSPRQSWQSGPISGLNASTTKLNLAWRIDTDGAGSYLGQDCNVGNDVWGFFLDGANCASIEVDVYYAGAWHLVTTTGVHQFTGVRKGNTIHPDPTSVFGGKWRIDEAAGASLAFYSAGYTVTDWVGAVQSNTEGATNVNGVTTKTPVFQIEAASGASSATPAVGIWPRRHLVIIQASGFSPDIKGIRIRIPVSAGTAYPGNPASGYFEIGTLAFGPMAIFGHDYSWQRNIALEANTELTEARDGRTASRVLGPAPRTLEVGWADGVDVSDWRSATGPDYLKASANASARAVAFRHDLPVKLQDLVRSINGPKKLLVYVPNIAYDSNSGSGGDTASTNSNWAGGAIYGRITSPVRIEQVLGDDELTEVYRVTTVTLKEEV